MTEPLYVTSPHKDVDRVLEEFTRAGHIAVPRAAASAAVRQRSGEPYRLSIFLDGEEWVAAADIEHWRTVYKPEDGVHASAAAAAAWGKAETDRRLYLHVITAEMLVSYYAARGWLPADPSDGDPDPPDRQA